MNKAQKEDILLDALNKATYFLTEAFKQAELKTGLKSVFSFDNKNFFELRFRKVPKPKDLIGMDISWENQERTKKILK